MRWPHVGETLATPGNAGRRGPTQTQRWAGALWHWRAGAFTRRREDGGSRHQTGHLDKFAVINFVDVHYVHIQ